MPSKKDRQRILSGGLNLLPPSDKLPEGDALIFDNWRVDQQGQLRSRNGCYLEAGPVGSGTFHTLGRVGDWRYAGIGSNLYWGPALQSLIASGFDGQPLGLAFYQGAAWVMNRNKQLRIKADVAHNWGIAAPSRAPSATAGAVASTVLNPYNADPLLSSAGYFDSNRVFQDRPQAKSITTDQGTIAVANGSTAVIGDGTIWDSTMTGQAIEILGSSAGQSGQYLTQIASVEDATHLTLVVAYSFDDQVGVSYNIYTQAEGVSFNVDVGKGGTVSTLLNSPVALPWYLVTNMEPGHDTRTLGTAQDEDVFTFPFYSDNPDAISSVVITLYSNQDTLGSSAPTVQATIGPEYLSSSPQSWTYLRIARAIDFDLSDIPTVPGGGDVTYPDPTIFDARVRQMREALSKPHFIEYQGNYQLTGLGPDWSAQMSGVYPIFSNGGFNTPSPFNWANVTGIEVVVNLKVPCVFGLGAADIVGNAPGALTGALTYFVSFANADGEDSNPSPGVDVSVRNQSVELDSIPVSSDPQVTERWIYRIGGGLNQALLVGKVLDNFTTSFIDRLTNVDAQNLGVSMPVNRTLPPPARGVMGPYLGKLIAYGSDEHPARYWWNNSAQPWYFPGSDEDAGNWEDAGNDDDPIVSITDHKRLLVIYKRRSIWRVSGDPVNADAERSNANVGLVGPRAVCNAGNHDYFAGPEGIYRFNGDFEEKISQSIDPLFKGDYVQLATGEYLPPVDKAGAKNSVMGLVGDRLRWSYPENGRSDPNVTLIYNTETGKWGRELYNLAGPAPTAMHYEGAGNGLMLGFPGGYLYRAETPANPTDGSNPIHLAWQSRFSDQNLPDNIKHYSDVELDFQTGVGAQAPSSLTVVLILDNGAQVTLGAISSLSRTTVSFQLQSSDGSGNNYGVKAKNAAIRIIGDVNSTCIVYAAYLHWYAEERSSRSYDSGFIGTERVRQVDYVEFVTTGAGQPVNRILSSDLPGSALVQRDNGSFRVPAGRGTSRFRIAPVVEGRNLRLTLGSGSPFQLHSARIRQREIGEYIDGTLGEYWESGEFSVAPGREGELKDLLLDYDAPQGGRLILYTDGPHSTLTEKRTMVIPTRTTRAPFVFAFEDAGGLLPYGKLFRLRVVPPANSVIRLHGRATLRARVIGVSFDGAAGERWETQPLDLVGGVGEFREIALVAQAEGPMLFQALTELPGSTMQTRASYEFDTTASTTGRTPIYFRVPGTTKGRLQQFRVTGRYACRLFECRVYGRLLGGNATPWAWLPVPMESTPDAWAEIHMPVRSTPEEFTWIDIPVDPIE